MFQKHNMTDASYPTPSHLDVWRLHSLNCLGKENNPHPLVSANHYKMLLLCGRAGTDLHLFGVERVFRYNGRERNLAKRPYIIY